MKLLSRSILSAILLLASLACSAAANAAAADCADARTQAEMNGCVAQDLSAADAELNETYVALRATLSPVRQNQIRDVQLAWIKYRDLSCRFTTAGTGGGSVHDMALGSCLADKTRQRSAELKALAHCQEGDLSCTR